MIGALDDAIDSALAAARVVGCVVLVSERGRIVFDRAAGLADREVGRPMKMDTPFRYASVTKPFTTMAALKLIEAGALSAEDPVEKWLPDFAPRMIDGTSARITVDQLMSHTAGLDYRFQQNDNGPYARVGVSDGLDDADISLAENLARIASVPLSGTPGSAWRYSIATDVLGAVVEAAAGKPLPQAITDLVVAPLGLTASFRAEPGELATPYYDGATAPRLMTGPTEVPLPEYLGSSVRFDPSRIGRDHAFPSGGAGMAGTAQDVMRLLEAFRQGDFLSATCREEARRPGLAPKRWHRDPDGAFPGRVPCLSILPRRTQRSLPELYRGVASTDTGGASTTGANASPCCSPTPPTRGCSVACLRRSPWRSAVDAARQERIGAPSIPHGRDTCCIPRKTQETDMTALIDLTGKVALVVGASKGIGAATARAFGRAGAVVVLAARDQSAIDDVALQIQAAGGRALAVRADVTDPHSMQILVARTIEAFGRLDAAFNNATDGPRPAPLAQIDAEAFDRGIRTNIHGTFHGMKFQIAAMLENDGGTIVNMASTAGVEGVSGLSAYVAGKAGIIGLGRVAALDYADSNIRVNVIAPGPILTHHLEAAGEQAQQMAAMAVPMGRLGTVANIADAVLWLSSPSSGFITGAVIPVDGGQLAGRIIKSAVKRDG
ncbi:SDR family oxidoreductase [Mesorhizobium sp. AR07]|uniref:SDR family oxidoreductase n=1 Tax=Mesorhizobium sp. AR07 TaxID=2865838 RepID=UPI00215FC8AC|nr:SDR family oxidoreductase [Mesorhizobium sp. AR07]UVK46860.1 SDR family oxidoreductase [Mesorhizobium sp. AR07]